MTVSTPKCITKQQVINNSSDTLQFKTSSLASQGDYFSS